MVPREDYRERMRRLVFDADKAAEETHTVTVEVSRQLVADLVEAFNQLNQMNPWYRGVARRLHRLGIQLRDALDAKSTDGHWKVVTKEDP